LLPDLTEELAMTGPSPFTALEETFRLLGAEPHPLTIDGRRLGRGLPCRQIPILELRWILTRPSAASDLQGQVIEAVLGGMRQQPATWVVVLGGLLLPALRCLAQQIAVSRDAGLAIDVEAELLSRLLTATRRPPCDTHRFAMHLLQLAQTSRAADHAPIPTPRSAAHRR